MPSPTKLWGVVSPVLIKEFWEILDNKLATCLSVLTTSFILMFWKFSELWKGHWKDRVRDNHIIVISHEASASGEANVIYFKYTVITLSFELTLHLQHLWREQVLTHMPTSDSRCEHLTGPEYHGPDWKRHIITTYGPACQGTADLLLPPLPQIPTETSPQSHLQAKASPFLLNSYDDGEQLWFVLRSQQTLNCTQVGAHTPCCQALTELQNIRENTREYWGMGGRWCFPCLLYILPIWDDFLKLVIQLSKWGGEGNKTTNSWSQGLIKLGRLLFHLFWLSAIQCSWYVHMCIIPPYA